MSAKAANESARKSGPKVLRVGIIQNGKIIEERLLRKRQTVTIGHHNKNTFHIPAADIPKSLTVFEFNGGTFSLTFDSKMSGRVSLGDGVHDLDSLRKSNKATKSGSGFQVKLNERSRGKVVLGEVTILFQFVTPPPPRSRPQLPATMRGGWVRGLDWNLIIIMAISAFLQGGSIWWVQAQDWPEPKSVGVLPDRFVQALQPPVEEIKKVEEEKKEPEKTEGEGDKEKAQEEKPKKVAKKPKKKPSQAKPVDPDKQAAKQAANKKRLAKAVENKTIIKTLGSIGGPGQGSLVDALSGGADRKDLDSAFANSTGVKQGSANAERSGLSRAGSKDATGTGSTRSIGNLKTVKGAGKTSVDTGKGPRAPVKVKARVNLRSTERLAGSGTVDKARLSAVFRARGGALRSCYERELKKNPKIGGKLVIRFTIGSAGRVTAASVAKDTIGSPAVGKCVASRIRGWKFPKPEGGSVSVTKSLLFSSGN